MNRRLAMACLACAVLVAPACGGRGSASVSSDPAGVPVDAATLWDPNALQDPIVTYRLRLATDPDNTALHNNLGNLYVLRNWMEEAIREYRKAIDLAPNSSVVWNNLGTAYMKLGKRGDAMSAFRRAVQIDPRYALAWYNIGVIHDEERDYEGAIEMYLKAASLNPAVLDSSENPQVVNNRHLTAVRLRRYLEEEGNLALPLEPMPE